MKIVRLIVAWILSILFGLLAVSMFLNQDIIKGLFLLAAVLLIFPVARKLAYSAVHVAIPFWGRTLITIVLVAGFVFLDTPTDYTSAIYKSPEIKEAFYTLYDQKMKQWPVDYQDIFIRTEYGRIHVIASGPEKAPPVMLLHASGIGSWSWFPNVKALSEGYRIYAIDTIGDAGKSVLTDRRHYPKDGQMQAQLLAEISEKLGFSKSFVVGASEGGFMGTNYALYAPDRVKKLVLLCPMGFGGTTNSIVRITLTQLFPLKFIQEATIPWAFGDTPGVIREVEDWFMLLLNGTFPQKARPISFTGQQLDKLKTPVLLVLGSRDNLLGNPDHSIKLAQHISNLTVEVLESGHLPGMEQADTVNRLILDFFK